jgi:hypothetical protein
VGRPLSLDERSGVPITPQNAWYGIAFGGFLLTYAFVIGVVDLRARRIRARRKLAREQRERERLAAER